jgi:hypothetical protein
LLVVGWIFIASREKSRPLLPPHIGSDRYRHIRHPSALYRKNWKYIWPICWVKSRIQLK